MEKIFEEYVKSADYLISAFFDELEVQVTKWFSEGSFGASGCQLVQIKNDEIMNPMEKTQTIDFISVENAFKLLFIVRVDEIEDGEISNVHLQIKKYSDNESQIHERELTREIDVEDIKEDFIIDKISELDSDIESEDGENKDLGDSENNTFG